MTRSLGPLSGATLHPVDPDGAAVMVSANDSSHVSTYSSVSAMFGSLHIHH